jgi:hypothetical protein
VKFPEDIDHIDLWNRYMSCSMERNKDLSYDTTDMHVATNVRDDENTIQCTQDLKIAGYFGSTSPADFKTIRDN